MTRQELLQFIGDWGPAIGMAAWGIAGYVWGWDKGFSAGVRECERTMRGQVGTSAPTSREQDGNRCAF